MSVCMCVHVCICACMCLGVSVSPCVYMSVCVHAHMQGRRNVFTTGPAKLDHEDYAIKCIGGQQKVVLYMYVARKYQHQWGNHTTNLSQDTVSLAIA